MQNILNDDINKIRMSHFKSDIHDKTMTAVLIIVIVLIGGRYLIELMKWVIKTSDLKNNSDRNTYPILKVQFKYQYM